MKTHRAADLITDILYSAGVRRIYGVVGDSLNGITDAIRRRGDIEWIHTRHEEAAAFAAGAEAHLTGELAVCAGSCGPGNLHRGVPRLGARLSAWLRLEPSVLLNGGF